MKNVILGLGFILFAVGFFAFAAVYPMIAIVAMLFVQTFLQGGKRRSPD